MPTSLRSKPKPRKEPSQSRLAIAVKLAKSTDKSKLFAPIAPAPPAHGRMVRMTTNHELIADMKDHGKQIRETKKSATAFLQSAGILDAHGCLATPYKA